AEGEGEKYNPEVTPVELHTVFDIPKNDWRGPVRVHWYQGGMMPRSPKGYIDLNKIGHGAMFKGTRGFIVCDYDSRIVLPFGNDADFTYYNKRSKDEVIPPLGHFQEEWIEAWVAYRVGEKLEYDGAKGRVTNNAKANDLLGRKYRPGWVFDG
ncbi:MAG: Gfo/Idh/MocA family protein, partial [Planctomycetota bacterium]